MSHKLIPAYCSQTDDYQALPAAAEKEVQARRVEDLKEFLGQLDVLTINCPLHESTRGIINKETLSYMKPGAWIVNTARGALCVAQDIADALESGHIAGYGGDVWEQVRFCFFFDFFFLSIRVSSSSHLIHANDNSNPPPMITVGDQ